MEGGRGKGKGKKAKKKANAAAKKAAANHTNVQVVTVSKALAPKAPLETKAEHVQPMTKAKRKRLKKQAAEAEKAKQAQQTNASPTSAGASPKTTKTVVVLTPPVASATTVKPHVVSLTGKKKKRKRVAALHATESDATATLPPKSGRTAAKTAVKTLQTKKTMAVLGHAASSPSAIGSAEAEVPVSASPKRKLAKVAQSSGGDGAAEVATKTASPKPADGKKSPSTKQSQQTKKRVAILGHSAALPAATTSTKKVATAASPKRKTALVRLSVVCIGHFSC
jgi:hypothetical protein